EPPPATSMRFRPGATLRTRYWPFLISPPAVGPLPSAGTKEMIPLRTGCPLNVTEPVTAPRRLQPTSATPAKRTPVCRTQGRTFIVATSSENRRHQEPCRPHEPGALGRRHPAAFQDPFEPRAHAFDRCALARREWVNVRSGEHPAEQEVR